jgi:hypothetical protein
LKEVFEEVIFSSNIIKNPKSLRDGASKEKKRKLQESHQIKGEVNILRGEKHFNFKNSF